MDLIITHENCDFDALASTVAAAKLYSGSSIMLPQSLQPNVRSFTNLYRDLLPLNDPKEIVKEIDSVVVVDTNQKVRLGKWGFLLDRAKSVTLYDHHPGQVDIAAELVINEAVGATTTILLEEIIKRKIKITEFEATLFALGIYEDTGCLTYEISTSRDARAVAYLWENGLNTGIIQEYLRAPLSNVQKGLLETLLRNSELYEINRRRVLISATVLDEYVIGAAVLLQLLDEIEDTDLTIVIIQMTDSIYLAARSQDDDLNLLELLAPFAVKGYPGAVSAHIKGMEADKAKEQVVEFLKSYLPPAISAEKIASQPVLTISSDTSINEADRLLTEHGFKGCPVVKDGRLVGIISHRDLRKGLRNNLGHAPVKGFMTRKLVTASPEQSLSELRRLMVEHNIGRVPIVDQSDKLVGIVTRSDILRHLNLLDRRGRSVKGKTPTGSIHKMKAETEFGESDDDETNNLMKLINNELSARIQKILLQISRLAEQEKVKIYLVGGMIRDLLLRYPPEKDLDFVVIGDAISLAFKLQKLLGGNIRHFEQFGTASLQLDEGLRLDLVTARKEFYVSPAALPQVENSNLKNDLFRRDFSINAMACSLAVENFGELHDYYNGQIDLQNKVIRVLYQLSFADDPLRMLRAVRFEQRYDFNLEAETLASIKKAVESNVLEKVSRQRLNQELKFIYKEPAPLKILKRFDQLGLISFLYPRANPDENTWNLLSEIEEILNWAGQRNWEQKPDMELTYLSGFLYGLESTDQSAIIRKLYLSRERASIVRTACQGISTVLDKLNQSELNPSMVVNCLDPFPVEAILFAHALTERKIIRDHLKLYMDRLRFIRPGIKGSDLIKIGLEPGPYYRKIIERLKQAVLDKEVRTPQEELDYVINYLEAEKRKEN